MCLLRELQSPSVIQEISGDARDAIKGVHPLRQVVIVLSVPVPFQTLINVFIRSPFCQILAYPQSTARGMKLSLFVIKPAEPTGSAIVGTVFPERAVHLIHKLQRHLLESLFAGFPVKSQKIANCESVSPQVSAGRARGGEKSGIPRKLHHNSSGRSDRLLLSHYASPTMGRRRASGSIDLRRDVTPDLVIKQLEKLH